MKRLPLFFLLVALAGCAGRNHGPTVRTDHPRPFRRALENTVVLRTTFGRAFCSGVVAEHVVFTAHHCVDHGEPFVIEWGGNIYRPRDTAIVWPDHDLAILHIADVELPRGVHIARRTPDYGDAVTTVGHHLGDGYPFTMTRGIVSNPRRIGGLTDVMMWMQHDAPILGGASGGPVLDTRGDLIGITSFGALAPVYCPFGCPGVYQDTDVNGAVHLDILKEALRQLRATVFIT